MKQMVVVKYIALSDTVDCTEDFHDQQMKFHKPINQRPIQLS